ncbi:hypothetical protein D3C87_1782250 [compost metagenome]
MIFIKNDFHRNTLHNLCEIARRVVRCNLGKRNAARRCDARDPAFEAMIGDTVDAKLNDLVRNHVSQLRLSEVGNHKSLTQRHYGHQGLPWRHIGPNAH